MLNQTIATTALNQHSTGISITAGDVAALLSPLKGTTFANVTQVTPVKVAARFKDLDIKKVTIANVQLFNNLKEYTYVYSAAVKRSAEKIQTNDQDKVENFEKSDNWFEHTECFSVVKHKSKPQFYLFALYNNAESVYTLDDQSVSKEIVADFCTPSEAKKLLDDSGIVENKKNGIEHTVIARTIDLSNIVSIKAMKQQLQK
jgi:hypothetical protein